MIPKHVEEKRDEAQKKHMEDFYKNPLATSLDFREGFDSGYASRDAEVAKLRWQLGDCLNQLFIAEAMLTSFHRGAVKEGHSKVARDLKELIDPMTETLAAMREGKGKE